MDTETGQIVDADVGKMPGRIAKATKPDIVKQKTALMPMPACRKGARGQRRS
jgi:hypothetical protein